MKKFQIGDKVVYTGYAVNPKLRNNTGIITRVTKECGKDFFKVRFDRPLDEDEHGHKYHNHFCFAENLIKLTNSER